MMRDPSRVEEALNGTYNRRVESRGQFSAIFQRYDLKQQQDIYNSLRSLPEELQKSATQLDLSLAILHISHEALTATADDQQLARRTVLLLHEIQDVEGRVSGRWFPV